MSASDKTKLNGIETGAQKNTITGIKGAKESSYRTGNVNITLQNILGSTPIGDDFTGIYYNGSTFVTQNPSLQSTSWSKIAELSAAGKAKKAFSIGDEREETLITGEKITLVILGFGQDEKVSGGKVNMTIGLKNLMDGDFEMNLTHTNGGGWEKSRMRTVYMERVFKLLPEKLRNIIVPVKKNTSAGGGSTDITVSEDKLFLFSLAEIYSQRGISKSDNSNISGNADTYQEEGTQYEYFKELLGDADPYDDNEEIIKRKANGGGSANHWWLRSPYVSVTNAFRCVDIGGHVSGYAASSAYGVRFGFCV